MSIQLIHPPLTYNRAIGYLIVTIIDGALAVNRISGEPMAEYADLEIGLHRREPGSYGVEFRTPTNARQMFVSAMVKHTTRS